MKRQYLIRLDDACPTMNRERWSRMERLLDQYGVKPMVGIVPDCKDENLMRNETDPHFWEKALAWQQKGWAIAMHGYDHCYVSAKGMDGLNPMWPRSEFAGMPLEEQRAKIRRGVAVLTDHGLEAKWFFAPSHTFDENTLKALSEESNIRMISDTIALRPYRHGDFTFFPQIAGRCVQMPLPGVYTFCFHPNTMSDKAFDALEAFLKKQSKHFIAFSDLETRTYDSKGIVDRLLAWLFFTYRKMKR